MAIWIAIPILSILLIFQSSIFSYFTLLNGTADLIMLVLIAWALQKRVQTAWHWCIIGGLLVSIISALPFGVSLIGYSLVIGIVMLLRQRVWQVPILAMYISTFFGTLITHLITIITLRIMGTPLPIQEVLNTITLPSLLLNLILALPVYALINELADRIYPEELEV
jgi:rod shape-determining protein MreD